MNPDHQAVVILTLRGLVGQAREVDAVMAPVPEPEAPEPEAPERE